MRRFFSHFAAMPLATATWGVTLVALVSLAWSFRPLRPLHERVGWADAAAWLRQEIRNDTLVVVWPPALGASVHALPAEIPASDAVPIEPAQAHTLARFLVLGPHNVAPPPELRTAELGLRQRFGDLEVLELLFPVAERALFDLRHDLKEVKVALSGPTLNQPCAVPRPDGGWACAGQPDWNHVGPASLQVNAKNWESVWVHPRAGHVLYLSLGERELGDRLVLEAALTDDAARTPQGATVEIKAGVTGVGEVVLLRNNAPGVAQRELKTPPGRRAEVWVSVTTPNDGRRHLGINLRLLAKSVNAKTKTQGEQP